MTDRALVQDACRWCYEGVWKVLTDWFNVSNEPPLLPAVEGETVEYLRPAPQYLEYMKFQFWIGLVVMDLLFTGIWIAIAFASPLVGILITPLALAIIVLPDIFAYIAVHLRYDTTWYVLSDRSMRIRRGIWIQRETTITFENIQNIHLVQGPIERWFGIGNLLVMTAGGGNAAQPSAGSVHFGLLQGISNANEIRESILSRCRSLNTAGLGDEPHASTVPMKRNEITTRQLAVLGEIRDITQRMKAAALSVHD